MNISDVISSVVLVQMRVYCKEGYMSIKEKGVFFNFFIDQFQRYVSPMNGRQFIEK